MRSILFLVISIFLGSCQYAGMKPKDSKLQTISQNAISNEKQNYPTVKKVDIYVDTNNSARIEFGFSEPMQRVNPESIQYNISPKTPCIWYWEDAKHLICDIHEGSGLKQATKYQLTIGDGLYSMEGKAFKSYIYNFETLRPEIYRHDVEWKSPTKPEIAISFNIPIQKKSLKGKLYLQDFNGNKIKLSQISEANSKSRYYEDEDYIYFAPDRALLPDTVYVLHLSSGIKSQDGLLGSENYNLGIKKAIKSYGEFKFYSLDCPKYSSPKNSKTCFANDNQILEYSAPIANKELEKCTSDLNKQGVFLDLMNYRDNTSRISISTKFANQTKRLHCLETVKDIFGRSLIEEPVIEITTSDFEPNHTSFFNNVTVTKSDDLKLLHQTINFDKLYVKIDSKNFKNINQKEKIYKVKNYQKNKIIDTNLLDKRQKKQDQLSGYVSDEPSSDEYNYGRRHFFVQKSSYNAIVSKVGNDLLVFISDIKNNKPVANTKFKIEQYNTQKNSKSSQRERITVKQAKTNASGIAVIRNYSPYISELIFTLENGEQFAVNSAHRISSNIQNDNGSYDDYGDVEDNSKVFWGLTDKPLYRQGETVKYTGFLRQIDGSEIILTDLNKNNYIYVDGYSVYCWRLEYCDSFYIDKKIKQDEFGRISGSFVLPKDLEDGEYTITIEGKEDVYSELFFTVANFKAQKLKVETKTNIKDLLIDKEFLTTTSASYYSGGAYTGASTEVSIELVEGDFNTKFSNYKDYYFTPNKFYNRDVEDTSHFFNGKRLDNSGKAVTRIILPDSQINFGNIKIQSSIMTDEGESVSSRLEEGAFSKRQYYVGIKNIDRWQSVNKPVDLESIVLSVEGKELKKIKVDYYIKKIPSLWYFDKKKNNTQSELIECSSSNNQYNKCTFTQKEKGYYEISARITYPDGSIQESSSTHYFKNKEDDKPDLVLQAGDEKLQVGSKVKFNLQHDIADSSALVILHRNGLLDYWWQPLTGNSSDISFEVKEPYLPGFDMTIFVNYGDLEKLKQTNNPDYAKTVKHRFEVVNDKEANSKLINIKTNRDKYKPGETVKLKIDNLTKFETSVLVAVIDESIINQVSDSEYFDPENSDLSPQNLYWSSPDMYELSKSLYSYLNIIEDNVAVESVLLDLSMDDEGLTKITVTGSRIERSDMGLYADFMVAPPDNRESIKRGRTNINQNLNVRSIFKEAAYWNNDVIVKGKSNKTLDITMPDNLTSWKVIAIATNKSGKIDLANTTITTSKDIEIHVEAPGQLTEGDKLVMQAEVLVKSDKIKNIKATAQSNSKPDNKLINQTSKEFITPAMLSRNKIDMNVEVGASSVGSVDYLFTAESEVENDGILLSSEVYSKNMKKYRSYYSVLPEDKTVNILLPEEASSNQVNLSFNLSGSVHSHLSETFDYMKSYPHQCWEQKLSRAVVAAINLQSNNHNKESKKLLQKQIQDAVDSMKSFQSYDGGMSFFGKHESTFNPYLSAYSYKSIQYLEKNHNVKFLSKNVDKLKKYLEQFLRGTNEQPKEMNVMVVNALSHNKGNMRIVHKQLSNLLKSFSEMDIYTKSQILEAINQSGFSIENQKLISELLDDTRETEKKYIIKDKKSLPWYFYSFESKKYCSVVSSFISAKADKKVVYKFVNSAISLKRKSKGDFGNTISNAYCAIAIDQYVKTYEKNNNTGEFKINLDDDKSIAINNKNANQSIKTLLDKGNDIKIEISPLNKGDGYLTTKMEYLVDGTKLDKQSNGFAIERIYYKYDNTKWIATDNSNINQGDIIKVRLNINNSLFRRSIAITDTLPGTFFALDENLQTSAPGYLFEQLDSSFYFYEQQLSSRNALFYADYLPAGNHMIEYLVKVTHKGKFSALPAKIEDMYDDDVYATSKPILIVVH